MAPGRRQEFPTDEGTSNRMKGIRRQGTAPEVMVRRILSELGLHYRLNNKDLPGSPDVANRRRRWSVFVHGCFWHHHEGCRLATIPSSNRDAWVSKFAANRQRDERKKTELETLGFNVVTVWQCELKEPTRLKKRLRKALSDNNGR